MATPTTTPAVVPARPAGATDPSGVPGDGQGTPGGHRGSARRPRRAPAYLWVPAGIAAMAAVLPLGYLLVRAGEIGWRAVDIALETQTLRVLANTVVLAMIVTVASIAIAVPLAWLTTRTDLPGRRLWAVLTALPLVVPSYVGAFTYVAAFGPRGMLQSAVGVERLPEIYGLFGAAVTLTLFSYPYVLLTVRGALLGMDPALEEASRSLGVSRRGTFRRVILPLLRPSLGAGSLLVALYVLSDFGAVSLMRFDSFSRIIYVYYRAAFDRAPAAVLGLMLVAFTSLLLVVEARVRGRATQHRSTRGAGRAAPVVPLGRWRWPATAFCATVVTLALLVPLGVMTYWLVRGVGQGEPLVLAGTAAWNSVRASGLAAVVAVAAALPVAILSVRHRSRATALAERATYVGHALPGIVVALSLVFFGARHAGPLYQTLWLLVLAYVVLFLPQAVGAARSSVLQVPPSVEEAARGLGRTGFQVTMRVTAPLMRPGLLAGAALVFLTAMKELPATLLLGPTGYTTLATATWSATSEAFYARAAAPALILVLISGVPMAVLLGRRHGFGGMS